MTIADLQSLIGKANVMWKLSFDRVWARTSVEILDALVRSASFRKGLLRLAEGRLRRAFLRENLDARPLRVQEEKVTLVMNLLRSVERAVAEGRFAPGVRRAVLDRFFGHVISAEGVRVEPFRKRHGFFPPSFVTLSPTGRCNLKCTGCYAGSDSTRSASLPFALASRMLREKTEEWGSYFTVISGGEPFLYRESGKTLFDLFAERADNYFMVYTNGTLLDREATARLADLGNVTPAISVEGLEKETDARRGRGVHRRILKAMENLRRAGVPFGISVTATRHNAERILSDEVISRFFNEEGAIYGWIFQYMPIGLSFTTELMVTAEQRLAMFHRTRELVHERGLFLVDFWNSGPASSGCLAGGRPGGYFYVNWNGNITPCVFVPYAVDNLRDLYARGGTITDVLHTPVFREIRRWQDEYGYARPGPLVQNWIVPCPIRDHYAFLRDVVTRHHARPIDEQAAQALEDDEYRRRMIERGEAFGALSEPVWKKEYLSPELGRNGGGLRSRTGRSAAPASGHRPGRPAPTAHALRKSGHGTRARE